MFQLLRRRVVSMEGLREDLDHGPVLFHASTYKTSILQPGFKHTGILVEWDDKESNQFLYATTDKEMAIALGIASAIEKKYPLDRFIVTPRTVSITINEPFQASNIEKLQVWLYTVANTVDDGWIKNNNSNNSMTNEFKTHRQVPILSCELIDVKGWLHSKRVKILKV